MVVHALATFGLSTKSMISLIIQPPSPPKFITRAHWPYWQSQTSKVSSVYQCQDVVYQTQMAMQSRQEHSGVYWMRNGCPWSKNIRYLHQQRQTIALTHKNSVITKTLWLIWIYIIVILHRCCHNPVQVWIWKHRWNCASLGLSQVFFFFFTPVNLLAASVFLNHDFCYHLECFQDVEIRPCYHLFGVNWVP